MIPRLIARLAMFIAVMATLCGCGFRPMLAQREDPSSAPVAEEFSQIKVGYAENRSGQVLHNALVDILNPRGEPDHPLYSLSMRIEEPQQNLAFQRNNSVTNASYGIQAFWTLRDSKGIVLLSSASGSSQQYIISTSQFATGMSAQNTRDQVVLEVSQNIRNQLALYFLTSKAATARNATTQ